MSAPMFPGLADRLRSRGAGVSTTLPAAGPPTTGLVRKPLPSGRPVASEPTPAAAAAPSRRVTKTSKKTRASASAPRSRPAAGAVRPRSCLGCLRSALAGKQGSGDLAVCRETSPPSGRCYKCASGHSCEEIPALARPPASRFLAAVASGDKDLIIKWRPVVKGMLEIWEEEKEGGGVVVAALSAEEKKEEAKRAVLRLVDVLF
ncbi:hypothetical protein PspLS_12157 [Pyricularia sp. CBS 133598]|nr:hypothetical protein PspLS_12157 [Pyricularia sp. CBS 133598]